MIKLLQLAYSINKLFNRIFINKANFITTPIKKILYFNNKNPKPSFYSQIKKIPRKDTLFILLVVKIRIDITFVTLITSYFVMNLNYYYVKAIKQFLNNSKK